LSRNAKGDTVSREPQVLIRLTPSARRRILACRRDWGWRPGLPVLVSRLDYGFEFRVLQRGDGRIIEFSSRGVRLAVLADEADFFRGSVLSCNHDCLYELPLWWLANPNDPLHSGSSDPLRASCCPRKFRRLHPELFGLRGLVSHLFGRLSADDRDQLVARTSDYLFFGDSRAAVVLQTAPLVVAAYCDEMDATVLLRFPPFLAREYHLEEGTRLVTANVYRCSEEGELAPDLVPGPAYTSRWTHVCPLIADFLAAEVHIVKARRQAISEREYRRCWDFGQRALREGQPIRSGRPLEAGTPGTRR
jgi:hypothetical protein